MLNAVFLTSELSLEGLSDVPVLVYLAFLAVMSIITFFAYGIDKKKAIDGTWRTKEKTLLGLSLLGGAFGGFAARKVFRHKTKHWYFWAVSVIGIVVHVALLAYIGVI